MYNRDMWTSYTVQLEHQYQLYCNPTAFVIILFIHVCAIYKYGYVCNFPFYPLTTDNDGDGQVDEDIAGPVRGKSQ